MNERDTVRAPGSSRRERPAKPALSYEAIVGTAVEIMAAEGLERLTMRRLAQELDTGAASLYVYVRNTAELHAAVLERLLGDVDLRPAGGQGGWRARLVTILTSYTLVLFANPSLARSALISRPVGPNYLALVEAVLALLAEGGVAAGRAAWGVDLLLHHATSTAAEHGTRDGALDSDDEQDALGRALTGVDPDRYPHVAALGDDLLSGPGEARLGWAFDVLITGVLRTPRPSPPRSRTPRPGIAD